MPLKEAQNECTYTTTDKKLFFITFEPDLDHWCKLPFPLMQEGTQATTPILLTCPPVPTQLPPHTHTHFAKSKFLILISWHMEQKFEYPSRGT